jgi:DNA polymerase (family X)
MKENIIQILENIALLLQIKGENFFKFSAYSKGADILRAIDDDIVELVNNGKLSEINGIGKALNEKISDYVRTGKMTYYENLIADYPLTLLELLKIDGLGAKKVQQIYNELKVKSIEELEKVCNSGQLENLKGFSKTGVGKILVSIQIYRNNENYKERKIDFDKIQ